MAAGMPERGKSATGGLPEKTTAAAVKEIRKWTRSLSRSSKLAGRRLILKIAGNRRTREAVELLAVRESRFGGIRVIVKACPG